MLKNIERRINLIKGGYAFLKLIQDPKQLDKVIEISQRLAEPEQLLEIANAAAKTSPLVVATALDKRERLNLEYLYEIESSLNEGTLGQQYLKFMRDRNLDARDLPRFSAETPALFVQAHLIETHDLWHVICGFETDEAGELGLQAFYLAQIRSALNGVLIGGGFLNSALKEPQETDRRMDEVIRGWTLGKNAKQLFGIDWNKYWNVPLPDIRKEFNLT